MTNIVGIIWSVSAYGIWLISPPPPGWKIHFPSAAKDWSFFRALLCDYLTMSATYLIAIYLFSPKKQQHKAKE